MTNEELEKLKAEEAAVYEQFHAVNETAKVLASKWCAIKQKIDRENLRREILAEEKQGAELIAPRLVEEVKL